MLAVDNFDDVSHLPNLDNVLVIENFIKENSGEFKKKKLWENLHYKIIYETYQMIFDYLDYSGKIAVDKKGYVIWIYNPKLVDYYLNNKNLEWKKEKK